MHRGDHGRHREDLGHAEPPPEDLHRREAALELLEVGRRRRAVDRLHPVLGDRILRHLQDHRRHRAEQHAPRGAVVGALLPVLRGGEAGLEVAGAPGVHAGVADDVEPRRVEERQRRREDVVLRPLLAVAPERGVEVEVLVGVDGALGPRRCAGRVHDRRVPVVGRERPRVVGRRPVEPVGEADDAGAVDLSRRLPVSDDDHETHAPEVGQAREALDELVADDDRLDVAVLDHGVEQRAARFRVERHGQAAAHERAVERDEELRLVAHEQADVRSCRQVAVAGMPDPAGLLPRAAEREAFDAVEDDPVLLRTVGGAIGQHADHRALAGRVAQRVGPEVEALTLQQPVALDEPAHAPSPRGAGPRRG